MKTFLEFLEKIDSFVYGIQKWVLIAMCVAITAINIAQVTGRYVFFYSIPWSEQLSVVLFLFIIFLGQNLATKSDNEIRIDILVLANENVKKALLVASDVVCLASSSLLFSSSIGLIQNSLRFPQVISSLYLPYFYVFMVLPIGFFLIFFSRLSVLLHRFVRTEASSSLADEQPQ